MNVGYSGTPLAKKLGITEGCVVCAIDAPDDYRELLHPIPSEALVVHALRANADLVHIFTNSRDDLLRTISKARHSIKQDGSIWVSWYKKAARLPTEITEDTIREAAFSLGLVDVKVCAVDNKWSALKLVIRKELRRNAGC